ncbi:MAG: FHA domain-containing protein, partial [bacterium]|nr:FHA domain-containing protein [bacterium]
MAWSSGLQLRVTAGNDEGRVISLNAPEITLGRAVESSENSPGWVLFSEPTVSRIHAVMQWSEEQQCYILQHRSRTNPTLVDGSPIESHPLRIGERVGLGLLEFLVEASEIRSGKLGDAVQAPRQQGISAPVFDALNSYAEERSREQMAGI